MKNKDLEIYINGSKPEEVLVFLGDYLCGGINKICISASRNYEPQQLVSFSASFLAMQEVEKPKETKNTITIIIKNYICKAIDLNNVLLIKLGGVAVGGIYKLYFESNVSFPYNTLKISPAITDDIFDTFPEWVEIDTKNAIQRAKSA